jgi:hypothetical protein
VYWSTYKVPLHQTQKIIKPEFCQKKKKKILKFHENPSGGSRVVPGGQADIDEATGNSRFSQFCERI